MELTRKVISNRNNRGFVKIVLIVILVVITLFLLITFLPILLFIPSLVIPRVFHLSYSNSLQYEELGNLQSKEKVIAYTNVPERPEIIYVTESEKKIEGSINGFMEPNSSMYTVHKYNYESRTDSILYTYDNEKISEDMRTYGQTAEHDSAEGAVVFWKDKSTLIVSFFYYISLCNAYRGDSAIQIDTVTNMIKPIFCVHAEPKENRENSSSHRIGFLTKETVSRITKLSIEHFAQYSNRYYLVEDRENNIHLLSSLDDYPNFMGMTLMSMDAMNGNFRDVYQEYKIMSQFENKALFWMRKCIADHPIWIPSKCGLLDGDYIKITDLVRNKSKYHKLGKNSGSWFRDYGIIIPENGSSSTRYRVENVLSNVWINENSVVFLYSPEGTDNWQVVRFTYEN